MSADIFFFFLSILILDRFIWMIMDGWIVVALDLFGLCFTWCFFFRLKPMWLLNDVFMSMLHLFEPPTNLKQDAFECSWQPEIEEEQRGKCTVVKFRLESMRWLNFQIVDKRDWLYLFMRNHRKIVTITL